MAVVLMNKNTSGKISALVIAGETSGDMHTAKLISRLKTKGDFEFFGIGGDAMAGQGVEILFHVNDMAFLGFLEVVKHLPFIKKVFRTLKDTLRSRKPDFVLLTDYPGLNLKFAKAAKKAGIPVVYFISPQVWAWGKGRIYRIARYVDKMLVILPFEKDIYLGRGLDTEFVGHPLKDAEPIFPDKKSFFIHAGLNPSLPCVALLPGSRRQEISKLLKPMIEGYKLLKKEHPELQAIIAAAPHQPSDLYTTLKEESISVVYGKTKEALYLCDAAIVASGTATLECAIASTPMVVVYKLSQASYLIGKTLIKLDTIALANIVAGKKIVPELIQHDVNPHKIAKVLSAVLFDKKTRTIMKKELNIVSEKLGHRGASERAAISIMKFLREKGFKTA